MIGPEIDLSDEQGAAIARGLFSVARCDGSFDPREKELITSLLGATEDLADIAPEDLPKSLRGDAARLFLRSCFLVAFADRDFSDPERKLIERYASAVEVSPEELVDLGQSVKEYLLAPLSRLSNTDAVVNVSKKLGV